MELNENTIKYPDEEVLLRYINETAYPDERARIDAWLAEDQANEKILLQLSRIYFAQYTQNRVQQRDPHLAWESAEQSIAKKGRRILFRKISVAASLLIGLLGITSFFLQQNQPVVHSELITVTTNAGMRSQVELPDGTTVHLNANSTLVYPSRYDLSERRVRLSGEGYFKVAHREEQPFIVTTGDEKMQVKVLGTEFSLQAYEHDQRIQTTLVEGSVQLKFTETNKILTMIPSDQVIYDLKANQIFHKKVNTSQEIAWKNGELIFRDTPMPDVLRQLNHFYSVEFDVKEKVISDYVFTGTFKDRPLFQILDYMKISSKIDYQMIYPEHQEVRKPVIKIKKIS